MRAFGWKSLGAPSEAIQKLIAARLAADVLGVPTLIMARTDANSAHLLLSDIDPCDRKFLTGKRTSEGFFQFVAAWILPLYAAWLTHPMPT